MSLTALSVPNTTALQTPTPNPHQLVPSQTPNQSTCFCEFVISWICCLRVLFHVSLFLYLYFTTYVLYHLCFLPVLLCVILHPLSHSQASGEPVSESWQTANVRPTRLPSGTVLRETGQSLPSGPAAGGHLRPAGARRGAIGAMKKKKHKEIEKKKKQPCV